MLASGGVGSKPRLGWIPDTSIGRATDSTQESWAQVACERHALSAVGDQRSLVDGRRSGKVSAVREAFAEEGFLLSKQATRRFRPHMTRDRRRVVSDNVLFIFALGGLSQSHGEQFFASRVRFA
jgi:hypothetical protein